MDICELFERMESEIQTEISFPDKFLLAYYNETEGICYVAKNLCQTLGFFEDDINEFLFVQGGEYVEFDSLDKSNPFWAIEKSPRRVGQTRKFSHRVYFITSKQK